MLQLDSSPMEAVTVPYQPSLVPYCINKQPSLLAPPLHYILLSPSCTLLHTLPLPTECLQVLLHSPLDIFKNYTSREKLLLVSFVICCRSDDHDGSYIFLLYASVAATCQTNSAPGLGSPP